MPAGNKIKKNAICEMVTTKQKRRTTTKIIKSEQQEVKFMLNKRKTTIWRTIDHCRLKY